MPDGRIMNGPPHGPGQECVEWTNGMKKGGKIRGSKKTNGKKTAKHFSAGGYLVGPSHEDGGIPAIVDGVEPIEVEGGEFIINKQTVDAVGEDFLHKLNSTETIHHTGGFGPGQLPGPSKFKNGGKVNNRRSKMARGRRAPRRGIAPARKMRRGGKSTGIRRFEHGGSHCGPGMTMGQNGGCVPMSGGGYRRGGKTVNRNVRKQVLRAGGPSVKRRNNRRTRPVRKMAHGGMHYAGSTHLNSSNNACSMHSNDITSCNNHPGCHYDYQRDRCV